MSYRSVVWAGYQSQAVRAKLKRTQRLCLLSIIHPLWSAPTAGLGSNDGVAASPSLSRKVGFSTYLRVKHMIPQGWDEAGCFKEVRGHMGIWRKRESQLLQGPYPTVERVNKLVWEKERITPLPEIEDTILISTDASKCDKNKGYAWVAFAGDYAIQTDKEMEVHQAEQMTLWEALSWIKEIDSLPHACVILSDSQSAVKAVYSHEVNDGLTLDIKHLINSLKCSIQIRWVRGHENNAGNEYANILAREGTKEARLISYSSPFVPVSHGNLTKMTQVAFKSYWQEVWNALPMHRVSNSSFQALPTWSDHHVEIPKNELSVAPIYIPNNYRSCTASSTGIYGTGMTSVTSRAPYAEKQTKTLGTFGSTVRIWRRRE